MLKSKKRLNIEIMPKKAEKQIIYLPSVLGSVRAIAQRGLTDAEICKYFAIPETLFAKWLKLYPSFRAALNEGRTEADTKVVDALHKSALGGIRKIKTVSVVEKNGKKIKRERTQEIYQAANVEAQKFWLTNRDKENWKNRQSSETNIKAAIIHAERKDLIEGIFKDLTATPTLVENHSTLKN